MSLTARIVEGAVRVEGSIPGHKLRVISRDFALPKKPGLIASYAIEPVKATGVFSAQGSLVNHATETLRLGPFSCLELTIDAGDLFLDQWWMHKAAGDASPIGTFRRQLLYGHEFRESFSAYAEDGAWEMIPWTAIVEPISGHGYIFGSALAGRGRIEVTREGNKVTVVTCLDHDENYTTLVPPGETWAIPATYVLPFQDGFDEACHTWRQFVQNELRPPSPDPRYPVLVNNSWGSEMAVDEALARKMIDDAADLGMEMFGLDAGWFRGLGDWHPDPAKFPNGLAPIADYAHSKGLLFGLWVAWTQGDRIVRGDETVSFENPRQREWFGKDYGADWQKRLPYIGADLCLASEEARAWCRKELERIVRAYKIDLLEHDQRMIVSECARDSHGHSGHPADVAYRAGLGYLQVYDSLRREFPKLGFENCVNGGRMIDFASIQRCHYVCITDVYDRLTARKAFYDTSRALPPMMCEVYLSERGPLTTLGFTALLRSGLMGFCTIMMDTGKWSPEWRAIAKRHFQFYKDVLRPLIRNARLYHVSNRPNGKDWDGMQYYDPATGKGVLFAFRGEESLNRHVFPLRGLEPEATYRLESFDAAMPPSTALGRTLMEDGFVVRRTEPEASEIVSITRL